MTYFLDTNQPVSLGKKLASAGEGVIYDVTQYPAWVAKIFHTTFTGVTTASSLQEKNQGLVAKRRKVAAMVANKPANRVQGNALVVLAWPEHTLSENGSIVGFVMPKIDMDSSVEIHQITNTSDRMNPAPSDPQWVKGFTWRYLSTVAVNLCIAVEVAHSVGAVIGDFNERNILVSKSTSVSLIDCDSMQFRGPTGEMFLCGVGRPEYTAPELLGKDCRTTVRNSQSDLFALAVHIYMLLLDGAHPFQAGMWKKSGEKPKAPVLAKAGHYAGGRKSPLSPQKTAPPPTILPSEIQDLFERAFALGAVHPSKRPAASEWRIAIQRMIKTL